MEAIIKLFMQKIIHLKSYTIQSYGNMYIQEQ